LSSVMYHSDVIVVTIFNSLCPGAFHKLLNYVHIHARAHTQTHTQRERERERERCIHLLTHSLTPFTWFLNALTSLTVNMTPVQVPLVFSFERIVRN